MIRTEEEILKDFGKLGYYINEIPGAITLANHNKQKIIYVNKNKKQYEVCVVGLNIDDIYLPSQPITMQEHKLLHELFLCWGWLDEEKD